MTAKEQMNARIKAGLRRRVAAKAAEHGDTVTAVIERAFEAYLAGNDVTPPAPPPPDVIEAAIVPLERSPERSRKRTAKAPVPVAPAGHGPAAGVFQVAGSEAVIGSAMPCRHPAATVIDGVCGACGEDVWLP